MKRHLVVGGSAVVVLVAISCGGDGAQWIGDAMVDAGRVLRDGGEDATSDAEADEPRVMEVACSVEATAVYERSGTNYTVVWSYAELRDFDPLQGLPVAFLCARERSGTQADPDPCAYAGGVRWFTSSDVNVVSCDGVREVARDLDCVPARPTFEPGLVRVPCGYSIVTRRGGSVADTITDRYRTARITIR